MVVRFFPVVRLQRTDAAAAGKLLPASDLDFEVAAAAGRSGL
jgi:hypothetical protein